MKAKKKMSMYKNGGFNPQPDTSYQSPASKSARAKSANKARQIGESYEQAFRGDMKARQAARFAIKEFGKGDRAGRGGKMDELYDKMIKRKAVAERARQKAKALSNKDLSEFKEYKGGGKMYGKKGMKVKKYQEGGMNATGETGRRRSSLSSADRSGKTAYQQRQETKKRQMDLFEKELSEKGVYLPKQGQLVKELNVDYPIIPSKDESGRTVPFKEGYIRRGYSGADTRMNQKLGVKPIGQNLSK